MSIRARLSRIVRANRAARKSAPADPVQTVEAAHAQQVEHLDRARRSVADLAAQRRRVEVLTHRARADEQSWNRQAEAAVAMRHDDGAREYLRRAIEAGRRAETLTAQHRTLDSQVRQLEDSLGRLERRVEDSRLHLQSLRAAHGAARASLEMREAATAAGREAVGAEAAALAAEREVRRLEARAAAYDELAGTDPDSVQVREAFEQLETGTAADARLEQLKRRQGIEPPR
ncbi:PspA/IM30 family protein [Georgenia subflava]|uniref:PspA/IM30 family protein n=1 Tax=Georgenia subflava TaxID=1622177 RepID=A0A6N7EL36_9MICO|nr:PspA/IM30 family protein [Georgenia subflava]MPV37537.1 hypothetical protein [Georgenia subflava]